MAQSREYDGQLLDVTAPEVGVQVQTTRKGNVLWVNVDGVCVLRVCQIQPGQLVIEDPRNG